MFKRLCAHYESVAVVCLLILITSISADLSKFYNDEGDIYEDYDYYEDDNITNYSEASDDQDKYGASQEKPPKKLNLADKVESGKLGTYSENDKHPEYKGRNINSSTGKRSENSEKEKISNKGPEGIEEVLLLKKVKTICLKNMKLIKKSPQLQPTKIKKEDLFPTSRVYTDVGKMSQMFSGVSVCVARPLKFQAVIGLAAV